MSKQKSQLLKINNSSKKESKSYKDSSTLFLMKKSSILTNAQKLKSSSLRMNSMKSLNKLIDKVIFFTIKKSINLKVLLTQHGV